MPLYLGRPGTALLSIASPEPGVDRSPTAHEGVHTLLGGGYAVDRAGGVCRNWTLSWPWDDEVWWILSALYRGQYGPGPFALIDQGQINFLTANQASGTDADRSSDGFSVLAVSGETLASSALFPTRAERTLKWSLPAAVGVGILTLSAGTGLLGGPVPAGSAWTLSCRIRTGASGDTAVDTRLALQWLDAAGAQVSETLGTQVTIGTTTVQLTASGSAPASAVYAVPRVKVSAGSVSAVADLHLDELQLQPGSQVTAWRPGEGPALVSLTSPREVVELVGASEQRRTISVRLVGLAVAA